MESGSGHQQGSTLRDYVRVLRRRGWIVAATVVVITAASLAVSARQDELYRSSADVLLRPQSFSPGLLGESSDVFALSGAQAERYVQTQVRIARLPLVAERVLENESVAPMTPRQFLRRSEVVADRNADVLQFSVTLGDRDLAQRLATAYGQAYTEYRSELDTASLDRALEALRAQMAAYDQPYERALPVYASLAERLQQLTTARKLSEENAFLVRPADSAAQVQPRAMRNAVLAGVVALLLGFGLALLRETLDTRVRTTDAVGGAVGLPLLARLAEPPRRLRGEGRLVMIDEPYGPHAEAFRLLRTNLDFANAERGARMVMVTSGVEGEGKTTTTANLAVALARSGRRVAVVDLDLRRPQLHQAFGIEQVPGITDVTVHSASLADVVKHVTVDSAEEHEGRGRNGHGPPEAFVDVVPAGTPHPDPGEFVGNRGLAEILDQLAAESDVVLIDAPPLLGVVDAVALSSRVDGLLLVVRLNAVRRPVLRELRRVLDTLPVSKLGFVATAAETEDGTGYVYRRYDRPSRPLTIAERARAAVGRASDE